MDIFHSPGVSIIICCYNSQKRIEETLQAVSSQENEEIPFEVILVDNNCKDDTVAVAKKLWNRQDVELKIISEPRQGLSYARKRGASEAKYSIVSFIDDDNLIENSWVKKIVALFLAMPHVGIIGSHNYPLIEGEQPLWFNKFQGAYACGLQGPASGIVTKDRQYVWGAGLSIRTRILHDILLSSPSLFLSGRVGRNLSAGEDSEICFRAILQGWDLWYENDLNLQHRIEQKRLQWKYLCKMFFGFGYSHAIFFLYKKLLPKPSQTDFKTNPLHIIKNISNLAITHRFRLLSTQEGERFQLQFLMNLGTLRGHVRYWWRKKKLLAMLEDLADQSLEKKGKWPKHLSIG